MLVSTISNNLIVTRNKARVGKQPGGQTVAQASTFPRRSRAACGRDGAAASRFGGDVSQLSTLSSGTTFGFSIAAGDALPGRLSSLLGVLHLFTPLGISVVILCNIFVSEFGAISGLKSLKKKGYSKQISVTDSAST